VNLYLLARAEPRDEPLPDVRPDPRLAHDTDGDDRYTGGNHLTTLGESRQHDTVGGGDHDELIADRLRHVSSGTRRLRFAHTGAHCLQAGNGSGGGGLQALDFLRRRDALLAQDPRPREVVG